MLLIPLHTHIIFPDCTSVSLAPYKCIGCIQDVQLGNLHKDRRIQFPFVSCNKTRCGEGGGNAFFSFLFSFWPKAPQLLKPA